MLPLRVNADQTAVEFLAEFFGDAGASPEKPPQVASGRKNSSAPAASPSDNTFFQTCQISTLRVKADYTPQRMDYKKLREGDLIQLMNLIPLSNSNFALSAVDVKGVLGWQSLLNQIYLIWYTDLSAHIRSYAQGITPIRSLGNVRKETKQTSTRE